MPQHQGERDPGDRRWVDRIPDKVDAADAMRVGECLGQPELGDEGVLEQDITKRSAGALALLDRFLDVGDVRPAAGKRIKQWAVRLVHPAPIHASDCALTVNARARMCDERAMSPLGSSGRHPPRSATSRESSDTRFISIKREVGDGRTESGAYLAPDSADFRRGRCIVVGVTGGNGQRSRKADHLPLLLPMVANAGRAQRPNVGFVRPERGRPDPKVRGWSGSCDTRPTGSWDNRPTSSWERTLLTHVIDSTQWRLTAKRTHHKCGAAGFPRRLRVVNCSAHCMSLLSSR